METKERNAESVPTQEIKAYPDWKDMTFKEKWDELSFWGTGFIFADLVLAGFHEDLPVFIQLPITLNKLFEALVYYLA